LADIFGSAPKIKYSPPKGKLGGPVKKEHYIERNKSEDITELLRRSKAIVNTFILLLGQNYPGAKSETLCKVINEMWESQIIRPLKKGLFGYSKGPNILDTALNTNALQDEFIESLTSNTTLLTGIKSIPIGFSERLCAPLVMDSRSIHGFINSYTRKEQTFMQNLVMLETNWREPLNLNKYHLKRDQEISSLYQLL